MTSWIETLYGTAAVLAALLALAAWASWILRRRRVLTPCPGCATLIDRRHRTLCDHCLQTRMRNSCTRCRRRERVPGEEHCRRCIDELEHRGAWWDGLIARGEH